MSDNMVTAGVMAALLGPVPDAVRAEEIKELMAAEGCAANYEGTVVYMTLLHESIEESFHLHVLPGTNEATLLLFEACERAGVFMDVLTAGVFVDLWYNGTDAGHDDVTREAFLAKRGGQADG